jgi:thioredoxin 1
MTKITDAVLPTLLSGADKPVLVKFGADWCKPCKALAPTLAAISAEMSDRLTVVELDIEESPDTAKAHGIMSVPTLLLFRNGEVVGRAVGNQPKAKIEQFLNDHLD